MNATSHRAARPGRQRGWAGLIGLLIALAIVVWLGRGLLAKLLPPMTTVTTSHADQAGSRVPGGFAPADGDATSAAPMPRNELERAKGLQGATRDQAADMARRIDDAQKDPAKD